MTASDRTIRAGVLRSTLDLDTDVPVLNLGSLTADLAVDIEMDEDDNEPFGPLVFYTLDRGRLLAMLDQAAAGHDVEGVLLGLDAAALEAESIDPEQPDDGGAWYDRGLLRETLACHHQRPDGSCICDWSAPGGNDWAGHFLRVYEAKVLGE